MANLLPHLRQAFELTLLTDARRPAPPVDEVDVVALPVPGRLPEPFWLHASAARWLRTFDGVFHATYNALPLVYRGPSVLTFHDLAWIHHGADFARGKRLAFRLQARESVRRAGVVVTISEFSRRAIAGTYGVPTERIVLAPPAVDPVFRPERVADLPPLRSRLGFEGPYVVALGGRPRRALPVAVEAWRRLGPDRPALVVAGPERPEPEPGVMYAGALPDPEWSSLLAGALAFCYPTRYEGFGLPALEAAASGTPVVCARVGPLPEVLGEAAEWCASYSVQDIAEGLAQLVRDPTHQASLRAAGLARAASAPSWERSAEAVAGAYRRALGQ
jgi:alpha-1,3-rhamnosyl/mannosyltransferase